MKNTKMTLNYLKQLENKLCEKIVTDWESDNRFTTDREMQKYNCGIATAMDLVREMINSEDLNESIKIPKLKTLPGGLNLYKMLIFQNENDTKPGSTYIVEKTKEAAEEQFNESMKMDEEFWGEIIDEFYFFKLVEVTDEKEIDRFIDENTNCQISVGVYSKEICHNERSEKVSYCINRKINAK